MKILVISDTHLSPRFNQRKFNFLKRIIEPVDKIVINGDFWEGYESSFANFVNSAWKELFPLLKKRKAVYLYGNHDKKKYSDARVNLFSTQQGLTYKLKSGDKTFYFEHGDRITPFTDDLVFKTTPPRFMSYAWTFIEFMLVKLTRSKAIEWAYNRFNLRIQKYAASKLKENEVLICGHVSVPYFDIENHYINGGWIKHGIGQYLVIDDGKVTAFNQKY